MEALYLIYKISNNINGKTYIGETRTSVEHRWNQHCNKKSNCLKLKRAIQKYGKENFSVEQIDHAHNKDEAFQKERFWIDFYNSIDQGYNILPSGYSCNGKEAKKVYCIETKEIFDSVGVCARKLNASVSLVTNCCKGRRHSCKGFHICFLDENGTPQLEVLKKTKPHHSKVRCVETGEVFENAKEAAYSIGKSATAVNQCLYGKMKRCGGLHWEYIDTENFHAKENMQKSRFHKTLCVDTGEIFKTYTDAARSIGVRPSSIRQCCIGKSKTSGGYKWIFLT